MRIIVCNLTDDLFEYSAPEAPKVGDTITRGLQTYSVDRVSWFVDTNVDALHFVQITVTEL